MVAAHIAHDCVIGSNCILANNVMLAGHVMVEDLGGHLRRGGIASLCHLWQALFCVAGFRRSRGDVPPFMVVEGHPSAIRGVNRNGLKRRGYADEQIEPLKTAYRMLFSDHTPLITQCGGTGADLSRPGGYSDVAGLHAGLDGRPAGPGA